MTALDPSSFKPVLKYAIEMKPSDDGHKTPPIRLFDPLSNEAKGALHLEDGTQEAILTDEQWLLVELPVSKTRKVAQLLGLSVYGSDSHSWKGVWDLDAIEVSYDDGFGWKTITDWDTFFSSVHAA